jgi:hypothetical protein
MREFDQAIRRLKRFRSDLKTIVQWSEEKTAKEGVAYAKRRSSGKRSLNELARKKLDHPYAKRHGKPRLDPSIINSQSGEFRSSWEIQEGNTLEAGIAIVNFSPSAGYLEEGTKYMFARPIDEKILEHLRKVRPINLSNAIERATKQ